MNIRSTLCALGRHLPPHPYFATRNEDIWFGECWHCRREIIKKGGGRWREVPAGFRVVWRPRGAPALPQPSARS